MPRRTLLLLSALMCAPGLVAAQPTEPAKGNEPAVPSVQRLTKTYFPKFFLSYSPDGSHLTYSRHHDNRRAANKVLMGLRIVKADGTGDRALLPEFESAVQIQEHAAWSPDSKQLLVTGGGNDTGNASKDIFVCDVTPQFTAGNLRKVIPGASVGVGEQAVWSPDGTEFVAVSISRALWIFSADGKTKRNLVQSSGNYCFQPAWSPDGQWIAFSSDRDGNAELYKIREDGSDLTRLTEAPGIDCRPRWSPDGNWLLFTSNRDGQDDLHLMRADGTLARNLTAHPAFDDHGAWSPDGRWIAFISMRDGGFDIYRMPVPADLALGPPPKRMPKALLLAESRPGLVAHYTFDGESGDKVADRAGKNPLQLYGAKLATKDNRSFLEFDGQQAYADAGNSRPLQIKGALTMALWIRPDAVAGNGYVVSKHGWNLYLGADFLPRFETRDAKNSAWQTLTGEKKLPPGEWSHVACVFDPEKKELALYVNGKLSGRLDRTDGGIGAADGYPLEFGRYNASKSQHLKGAVDDMRIYNQALDPKQLAELASR